MGLFSSRNEVVVGTSVVRAIKDEHLPDSIRTGVTKAIFENGDVSDYVLEELISSIGVRADRAYEYAKKAYVHGVPSSDIVEASQGREELIQVLSQIEGAPVTLEYSFFGRGNFLHVGWMRLIALAGYDPATNKIPLFANESRPEVFLHDIEVCVPESKASSYDPVTLQQWGKSPKSGPSPTRPNLTGAGLIPHTPIQLDPYATEPYWRLRYAWAVRETTNAESEVVTTVYQEHLDFPILEGDGSTEKDHFHVKYVVNGITKYWMYQPGTGAYPLLDAIFEKPPKVTGSFFPFTYFRYDKKSESENKTSAEYKTTKRLAKYYGVDFDDVSASIDENPDIADVQQAMLIMAFPANTENEVERKYLFTFFENWFYSKNAQYRTPAVGNIASNQSGDANINVSSIIIQDKRFKMALSSAGLFRRRVVGNIGEVGKHTSGVTEEIIEVPAVKPETGEQTTIQRIVKNHFYKRQISPTLYDEIIVSDLKMMYYVFGEYTTTGDDEDDILLIPLDKGVTDEYSMIDKEELYARSLHFVFNSMKVIKLKWYQQDWFAGIMQIVGLIIAAITMSPTIIKIVAGLSGGLAAAMSAIWALLQKILQGIVVSYLFKIFVKIVGIDLAFLVAIVASIYGLAGTLNGSPVQGAPWASDFLQLGNGLTKAVTQSLSEMMSGLGETAKALEAFKETAQKELEEANKLLETNSHLSPFTIFGESPNDFYNRTVHSGNAGINAITAITNYVDMALTLPKLNDTIGDTAYV